MQQTLLLDSFSWNETITLPKILNTSDDSPVRHFVEVDLVYPIELHNSHNDWLLGPEKFSIQQSWLSAFAENFGVKVAFEAPKKLIETPFDKQNYVCHYRNLKLYLKHDSKSNLTQSQTTLPCFAIQTEQMAWWLNKEKHSDEKTSC